MTYVTEVIINSILSACGAAIFTGICIWVKGLYKKSKNYDQTLKALAHDAFFRYCRYLLPAESLTESELENLNFLYNGYHSLGLNSTGDKMYNQIIAKPIRTDEQKGGHSSWQQPQKAHTELQK